MYKALKAGSNICGSFSECVSQRADEYNSYGTVLAKEKNEEEAMRWLVRSVHICPMNWGCWLEMTALIGRQSEVRC